MSDIEKATLAMKVTKALLNAGDRVQANAILREFYPAAPRTMIEQFVTEVEC